MGIIKNLEKASKKESDKILKRKTAPKSVKKTKKKPKKDDALSKKEALIIKTMDKEIEKRVAERSEINQKILEKYVFGRPTKYCEKILVETCEYIEERENNDMPVSVEELAFKLKANQDSLYEWAKNYDDFSDALKLLKSLQGAKLINKGLEGTYNSTIAKLQLSSNHGYFEKVKEESKQDIQVQSVDSILDEIEDYGNS